MIICVDESPAYDVEFAPPVLLDDAPPGLACDSGAYFDPGTPIDPEQSCNDPFANTASTSFNCLIPFAYEASLPIAMSSSHTEENEQ